jgi:hypothetical protein
VGRILIHPIIISHIYTKKKKRKFLDDETNVVRPLTKCVELGQLLFLTSALRLLIDARKLSQKRKTDNRLQEKAKVAGSSETPIRLPGNIPSPAGAQ